MNIKRYVVNDMQEAMVKIKNQLGPDAVILHNRPLKKKGLAGLFSKPQIEVTVAYETEPRQQKAAKPQAAPELAGQQAPAFADRFDQPERGRSDAQEQQPLPHPDKLVEMERRMETISAAMQDIASKLHGSSAARRYCKEIQQQYVHLLDNEVEETIARALADEAQEISDRRKAEPLEAIEEVVRHRLGEPEGIRLQRFKRTVCVFLGPTGAGKTTTIAKIAARYAIHEKAKVGLITADAYRIAAHEQIKTYSDILEVPLKVIYKPEEITSALNELDDADLVLIDTPGKSPNDRSHQVEIASIIEKSGASDVFLVISATTGYRSAAMVAEQYRFVKDFKVLLTKLDETVSGGMPLNVRTLTGRQLSYITTGQSVPDDIELFDVAAATAQLIWKA